MSTKKVSRRGYFRKPTAGRRGGPVIATQTTVAAGNGQPPPPNPTAAAAKSASELGLATLPPPPNPTAAESTQPPPPTVPVERHPDAGKGWCSTDPDERNNEIQRTSLPSVHFEEAGDMLRHFEQVYMEGRNETGDIPTQFAAHDAAQLVAHLSSKIDVRRSITDEEREEINAFFLERNAQYRAITTGTSLENSGVGFGRTERSWSNRAYDDPREASPFEAFAGPTPVKLGKLDRDWSLMTERELRGQPQHPMSHFINNYYRASEQAANNVPEEDPTNSKAHSIRALEAKYEVRRQVMQSYRAQLKAGR